MDLPDNRDLVVAELVRLRRLLPAYRALVRLLLITDTPSEFVEEELDVTAYSGQGARLDASVMRWALELAAEPPDAVPPHLFKDEGGEFAAHDPDQWPWNVRA